MQYQCGYIDLFRHMAALDKAGSVKKITFPVQLFLITSVGVFRILIFPTLPVGRRIVCKEPAGLLPTL